MAVESMTSGPRPGAIRAGWGWMLLSTAARFYLAFIGALAAAALVPMLFGLTGSVVQSGSMEPHISTGDVVLSRAVPAKAPAPMGRVITFRAPVGASENGLELHRLVAQNENGTLVTAGDANHDLDSTPLARRNIISQACLLIPWIGLPSFWLTTGSWLLFGIWLLLTMAALMVEAVDLASVEPPAPKPPSDPEGPSGAGPDPDEAVQAARPEREPMPALLSRVSLPIRAFLPGKALRLIRDSILSRVSVLKGLRIDAGSAGVVLVAVFTAVALATAPLGLAAAAFTARTLSSGNNWNTSGPATKLAFTTQPSGSTGGIALATQPAVAVQDAGGNTVGVSSAPITLSITTPAGATLTCTENPTSAVAGVATFAGCRVDKSGTYTLTARSGTLTHAVSASLTIAVGSASGLGFATDPSGSTAGIAFGTQPLVAVQDAGGNTITSSTASVTLSITPPAGGAVLTCTANPQSAVSGVATFSGCAMDDAGTYTLTAASSGLTDGVSASFTITAALPTKLAFTTSPSGSTGGLAFATQPVVAVQDASGNTVTTSTASVDLSITTPAGATLTCTQDPMSAVSGVATFAGCRVDKTGTYTLTAVSSGLTNAVSTSFTITVGSATKLGFTVTPASTAANTAFAAQPKVAVQDAGGNTVTSSTASVTLSITTPAGATLACTTNPVSAVAGVATFAGCKINTAGTYTLTATASGLTSAVSTSIPVFGTATKLAFTTNPSNSTGGVVFGTQPRVSVQDAGGRTVSTSIASVTLANPSGATLTCTNKTVAASSGVATFAACRVDKAGTYTLTATATGLTSAVSASFTISVGPATKLAFTTSHSNSTGGIAFPTQPVVTVQDAGGNKVTTSTASVNLSITTPGLAVLTCTANPKIAVSGVATFAGCRIDKVGTYTLTAVSSGLSNAVSSSRTVSVGPAVKLGFTRSPSNTEVDTGFALQPMVAIQDAGGNTRTASSTTVTLAITPPAGGATLSCSSNSRTTSSGVATFSSCEIDTAGTYTLTATASGLTAGVSSSFTITAAGLAAAQDTPAPASATKASSAPFIPARDTPAPAPSAPAPPAPETQAPAPPAPERPAPPPPAPALPASEPSAP